MPRQNLTRKKVVDAAIRLMEEKNSTTLEMKELAAYLSIKPASLYNHIDSLAALYSAAGEAADRVMSEKMRAAISGKTDSGAIRALAECHRRAAKESPAMYRLYLQLPIIAPDMPVEPCRGEQIYEDLFRSYPLEQLEILQLSRMLRSLIHGFISLESGGYFRKTGTTKAESFDYMLDQFMLLLQLKLERRGEP